MVSFNTTAQLNSNYYHKGQKISENELLAEAFYKFLSEGTERNSNCLSEASFGVSRNELRNLKAGDSRE
jgi:hypothetical protein